MGFAKNSLTFLISVKTYNLRENYRNSTWPRLPNIIIINNTKMLTNVLVFVFSFSRFILKITENLQFQPPKCIS